MPCALPCTDGQKGQPRPRGGAPARCQEGSRANRKAFTGARHIQTGALAKQAFGDIPGCCCLLAHRCKNPACQHVGSQFIWPGHSAKGRGSRDVIVTAIGLRGQSGHRTGSETQISPGRRDVRSQLASKRQPFQAPEPRLERPEIPYIDSSSPACSVSVRVSDTGE